MDDTTASGRVTSATVERAALRDRIARLRNGLPFRELEPPEPPPAPEPPSDPPTGQHGDVGPGGDLVDELSPGRRLNARARRLAACITAATPELEQRHLENVLNALDRVPS